MNKQHKKVHDFIESISWLFEVQNYSKTIIFPKSDDDQGEGKTVAADIVYDFIYRTVTIRVYPYFFKMSKEEQVKGLIHEMCHCRTDDLADCAENLLKGSLVTPEQIRHNKENTTEYMAEIFYQLAIGKKKYFSDAIKEYLK